MNIYLPFKNEKKEQYIPLPLYIDDYSQFPEKSPIEREEKENFDPDHQIEIIQF